MAINYVYVLGADVAFAVMSSIIDDPKELPMSRITLNYLSGVSHGSRDDLFRQKSCWFAPEIGDEYSERLSG